LQDLQGPRLRVGDLPLDGIPLQSGQIVRLKRQANSQFTDPTHSKDLIIPLDIPDVTRDLEKGGRILMDDGNLEFIILKVERDEIEAKVIIGGTLFSHKGVNLPGTSLHIPGFTEKDKADLQFGLMNGIDAIAISFVRSASDINIIRQSISLQSPENPFMPIIAKLELPEAIDNLDQILDAADGVMVARGDLGVETSPSAVPVIQKEIIHAANLKAKLVITATQMLDSMIKNPRPTRAEASDVANAILDGTDAVMLSAETASGQYPLETVQAVHRVCMEAEKEYESLLHIERRTHQLKQTDEAIAAAAIYTAQHLKIKAIAALTQSGNAAQWLSRADTEVPIYALSPEKIARRKLTLHRGVYPYPIQQKNKNRDEILHEMEQVFGDYTETPVF